MFQNNVLFILGAGASAPYGFPLGQDLADDIKKDQSVFFKPFPPGNVIKMPTKFDDLKTEIQSRLVLGREHYPHLAPLNLNELEEFKIFTDNMERRKPLSIDRFLRDFPSLADLGTTLITGKILRCYLNMEDKFKASVDKRKVEYKEEYVGDNWYVPLAYDMQEDIREKELENNPFRFITFNYDKSLEQYLYYSYDRLIAKDRVDQFNNSIVHVYGDIDIDNSLAEVLRDIDQFQGSIKYYAPRLNAHILNAAIKQHKKIHLIRDGNLQDQKIFDIIDEYIERSHRIVFIGFGFDLMNIRILLGSTNDNKRQFISDQVVKKLARKEIFVMNYKGKMQFVSRFFKKLLPEEFYREYSEYSISDFYQNVVKTIRFDEQYLPYIIFIIL